MYRRLALARRPIRNIVRARPRSQPMPFVAPVGGLNARDAIANMPANDAITMDNVFPTTDAVETRRGYVNQTAGLGAPVKSLAVYNGSTGKKLLAFAGGSIFDTTTADPAPGPELSGDPGFDNPPYWQTAGAGISVSGSHVVAVGAASGFVWKPGAFVVAGNWYKFTITIDAATAGQIRAYNGSTVAAYTPYYNSVGTFEYTLQAASNGEFGLNLNGFTGTVSDLSLVAVAGPPVALDTGRATDEVQSTMFVNAGSYWLIMVDGQDVPQSFDGAAVADLTITGVTGSANASALFQVLGFKGRLYFAAINQAGFYYLPVGNIQGAVSYFDLGQVAQHGGNLAAMCSLTRDGGDGPDDLMVFIMDTGEYIVYAGYDPSNIANWELVGRFFVAPPIGKKPIVKLGGDSILLTQLGMISLSRIFDGEEFNPEEDTISYKLGSALDAAIPFLNTYGWQAVLHSFGSKLILNTPFSATLGTYYQYVMNTKTKAWCRFTGWDGISWAVMGDALFFGTYDGNVRKADTGYDDNGADIRCDVRQAYSYFDEMHLKQFHSARLITSFDSIAPSISVGFGVDFKDAAPDYSSGSLTGIASLWDIALWDLASWGGSGGVEYFEADLDKVGFSGSIWVRLIASGSQIRWFATQYLYEKGGLVGG